MTNISHISRALFSVSSTQAEPQLSSTDLASTRSKGPDTLKAENAEERDALPLMLGSLRPGEITRTLWKGAFNALIKAIESKRASETAGVQGVITDALIYNLLIPYFLEKPGEGQLMLGEDYDPEKLVQITDLANVLQKFVPNLYQVDLEAAKRLMAKAPENHLRVVGEPKVTLEEIMDVFPVLKRECQKHGIDFGVVDSRDDLTLPPTLSTPATIPELPPQKQASEISEKTPPSNRQEQGRPDPMVYPELEAQSNYAEIPSFPAYAPVSLSIPAVFVNYEIKDGLVYKNGKFSATLLKNEPHGDDFSYELFAIPMVETFGAGAVSSSRLGSKFVFALRSSRMVRVAAGVTGLGLAFFVGSELLLWKLED